MKSRRELIVNLLTFILALSLMPASGQAKLRGIGSDGGAVSPGAAREGLVLGKLLTRRNGKVLVNGNSIGTGATILSGTKIETSGGVRATVQVAQSGSFELSPNTIAVLEFNGRKMTGHLQRGCIRVNTTDGIEGVIITPDGASTNTGQAGQGGQLAASQKQMCLNNLPIAEPEYEKGGLSRLGPMWSWLLIAAGGYAIIGSTMGLLGCDCCDPSPSSPFDSR